MLPISDLTNSEFSVRVERLMERLRGLTDPVVIETVLTNELKSVSIRAIEQSANDADQAGKEVPSLNGPAMSKEISNRIRLRKPD